MQSTHDQHSISRLFASEPILADAVLDAQDYDGTLVALVHPCISRRRVRSALEKHWGGNVEIHCATDMMVGGDHRD